MKQEEKQQLRTIARLLNELIEDKHKFEDKMKYLRDWLELTAREDEEDERN